MNSIFSASLLALSLVTTSATAFAQRAPMAAPVYARPATTAPVYVQPAVAVAAPVYVQPAVAAPVQTRRDAMDDRRDAREFASLQSQFEQAVAGNNPRAIRAAIESFARAGRTELAELQRDARAARWTGGDHRAEFAKLQRATSLVAELDRAAQQVGGWRANPNAIGRARQAMNGFNQLALHEVRGSMRSARFGR